MSDRVQRRFFVDARIDRAAELLRGRLADSVDFRPATLPRVRAADAALRADLLPFGAAFARRVARLGLRGVAGVTRFTVFLAGRARVTTGSGAPAGSRRALVRLRSIDPAEDIASVTVLPSVSSPAAAVPIAPPTVSAAFVNVRFGSLSSPWVGP